MVFSNADEEIEKLKLLNDEIQKFNNIEIDKLFVSSEQIAQIFGCSERTAKEFMKQPNFPLIKIGGKSMVNIFALNDYTQQRIVLSEAKK